jgi:hypothetical protein
MIEIKIPNITYGLYLDGKRTFIHIPRDNESFLAQKEKLEFGCEVTIKNSETKESIVEVFWHLFDYKECDRFFILVFKWEVRDALFYKRAQQARLLRSDDHAIEHKECLPYLSKQERHSHNLLTGLTALVFMTSEKQLFAGNTFYFVDENGKKISEYFVVINRLRLRLQTNADSFFEVYSLFPMNLLRPIS